MLTLHVCQPNPRYNPGMIFTLLNSYKTNTTYTELKQTLMIGSTLFTALKSHTDTDTHMEVSIYSYRHHPEPYGVNALYSVFLSSMYSVPSRTKLVQTA